MEFLPYGKQWIDDEDIEEVISVLKSNWLTTGPKVEEFEAELASKVGAKYAVAFNSGTAALHAAYFASDITEGDEIITTPITFAATANAALYLGARPVFVDIDFDSGNLAVDLVEGFISKKTKALVPVDFAGQPVDLYPLKEIAQKHNLLLIEDAAHALGACYKGETIGSVSDMTIFSFHPVKHITTGEGGAVVTDNYHYYAKLRLFRSHGITRDKELLVENHGPWYYEMHELGYNYRITDIQCALGQSQLKKLDRFVALRKGIAELYRQKLSSLSNYIELPIQNPVCDSSWHLFVIKVKEGPTVRKHLVEHLHKRGIGVQVHYLPVYWHPYYKKLGYKKGICPEAERFYSSVVSLPMFPQMMVDDVNRVGDYIMEFFGVKL